MDEYIIPNEEIESLERKLEYLRFVEAAVEASDAKN